MSSTLPPYQLGSKVLTRTRNLQQVFKTAYTTQSHRHLRINVHYAVAQTLANKCYVDNIYSQVSVRILQDCNFASAFISLGLSESQREDDTAAAIVMQQPTGGRAQYLHPYRREQSHNEGQCCKGVKCLGGCQHLCVRVQFV